MFTRLNHHPYLKKVSLLLSSSVLGQLIPFLVMPILTRFYSPEAFAELGLFMVYVGVFSAMGTLKFDQAILLPKKSEEVGQLVLASISSLLGILLVAGLGLFWYSSWNTWEVIWLLLASFSAGLALLFIQWSNRLGKTKAIAAHKLTLGVGVSGAQWASVGFSSGLIIGKVVGDYLSLIPYFRALWPVRVRFNPSLAWEVCKRYLRFPLYLMPVTAFAYVANRFPLVVFYEYGYVDEGGEFEAVYRLSLAAATLLVSNLYLSFSEEMIQKEKRGESVLVFFKMHIRSLLLTIGLPAIPVIGFVSWFLPDVLGAEWEQTGLFFLVLSPFFLMYILVAPFVYVLLYRDKLKQTLLFELGIHGLKLAGLFLGLKYSIWGGLLGFSLAGVLGYTVYGGYVFREIRRGSLPSSDGD